MLAVQLCILCQPELLHSFDLEVVSVVVGLLHLVDSSDYLSVGTLEGVLVLDPLLLSRLYLSLLVKNVSSPLDVLLLGFGGILVVD